MAMVVSQQPVLLQFPLDRPVFLKEFAAGQYGAVPYFVSKAAIEIPMVLLSQLITMLIIYWPLGLDKHGQFFLLVIISTSLGVTVASIALLVGCAVASTQKVLQIYPLTFLPQLLFSGLFLPIGDMPQSLRWVEKLCIMKYAVNLMALTEFYDVKLSVENCEAQNGETACRQQQPGNYLQLQIIRDQSIDWDSWKQYLFVMLACLCVIRLVAVLILWHKAKYVF